MSTLYKLLEYYASSSQDILESSQLRSSKKHEKVKLILKYLVAIIS